MTGRTHVAGAAAAVSWLALHRPLPALDMGTLAACLAAVFIGGLAPDLDRPGSTLWRKVPVGCLLAWVARPVFVGGHRHLSHSLVGVALFAAGIRALLRCFPAEIVAPQPVWGCFMAAYLSHLGLDALTHGGIPVFFPLGLRLGFPPIRWARLHSGGWVEYLIVQPALWLTVVCLWGIHWQVLHRLVWGVVAAW